MLFNSYVFVLVFLPLVLAAWWLLPRGGRVRLGALVAASYAFYGWWDWRFVSLLAISTVVDYWAGSRLYRCVREGRGAAGYLGLSMACNLGLLAFFKYSGFFATSVNAVAAWLRVGGALPVPELVLPVGISFYTFQTMSYTIDLYRGEARPARSLLHFAAYVSMFPQLVAGPIVRYRALEDQLRALGRPPRAEHFARGIWFFVLGMAQKVLLADSVAKLIEPMFAEYAGLQFFGAWFAMLGYTCQLYFDFAGYSNMAVGLGWMLGFRFPQNFDSPYRAGNIALFWRRWHITLSSWLRDYVYIPLGGSRGGRLLSMRNLIIVMLLGGLWHGAGWTFVLWGAYHGLLLAGHAVWRGAAARRQAAAGARHGDQHGAAAEDGTAIPAPLGVALTFAAVVFGWVLFRAESLEMAGQLAGAMAGLAGWEAAPLAAVGGLKAAAILAGVLGIVFFAPNLWRIAWRPTAATAVALAAVFVVCVLRLDAESPFLYFQF